MTMSANQEEFDALRRLLAIKKYEQPPPGYFDRLSGDIKARLRSGEHQQQDWWQDLGEEAGWLQRFLGLLNARPAIAGAFGMLICGFTLAGIYFSQSPGEGGDSMASTAGGTEILQAGNSFALTQPRTLLEGNSTNPVLNAPQPILPGKSLFDQIGAGSSVQPVSYPAGGN